MQLQRVNRGDLIQLIDREVVEVLAVNHQATVDGLMTLHLRRPGSGASWVTAPMQPTAHIQGRLEPGVH